MPCGNGRRCHRHRLRLLIVPSPSPSVIVPSPSPSDRTVAMASASAFCAELRRQLLLAGPMISINLLQFGIQLVSLMFVGHLGQLALSSASIASSIATVTGSSFLMGMSYALETLCGQAYGARQYSLLGLFMQRAMVVLNATSILVALAWANMEHILLALGQDETISEKAGEYTLCLIPMLFAYATGQPLIKFLQAQSLMIPLLLCTVSAFVCHVPICYAMVYKSGLGSRGAALATSLSNWINVLLLMAYVNFSRSCAATRRPLSFQAFHGLTVFLRLAIPSAVMTCLEWWSYEALVLLSGLLPDPELETSALSICYNTAVFTFMIPSALGTVASTRVSNELGAGNPGAAYQAVYVAVSIASCEAVIVCTTLISLRTVLGRAYSNDEDVIQYISKLMPVLAASSVLDSIQGLLTGIVRGCGWQKAGAYINLLSYYVVGLPLAIVLAFVFHIKAEGLWMGISSGSVVQLIALVVLTWVTNWEKEAVKAAARVSSSPSIESLEPLLIK